MKVDTYIFGLFGMTLGFTIWGLPFIIFLYFIWGILAVMDIGTRMYIERRKKNSRIKSPELAAGIVIRAVKSILILIGLALAACLSFYDIPFARLASFTAMAFLSLFLLEEAISVVENSTEITKRDRTLRFLKKVLGIGLDTGFEAIRKKLK